MTAALLAQGYRATLVQSPPLIGSRSIVLALDTAARGGALITDGGGYPRIPSAGTTGDADQLMSQANDILGKINQIPIGAIGQQLNGFTDHLDQITASPEIKDAVVHLDNTLRQIDRALGPLVAGLNRTIDQLGGAATAARGVLGGPDANQDEGLAELIRQINQTARSLRALTDYLGRHPEAPDAPAQPGGLRATVSILSFGVAGGEASMEAAYELAGDDATAAGPRQWAQLRAASAGATPVDTARAFSTLLGLMADRMAGDIAGRVGRR